MLKKGELVSASFFVSADSNYKGEIHFEGKVVRLYTHSFDMEITHIESFTDFFSDEDITEQFGGIGAILRCYKHRKTHNRTRFAVVVEKF